MTAEVGPARLVEGRPRTDAAVAVVVPTHQGADTLAETLASVLVDPSPDVEVVVLDNASTDGTAEVLAAFDDPRLVVWRNPSVVPMIDNHNRAVALTAAPLVKVISADDLVEPGALTEQAGILAADPSLAVVAGRCHFVDSRGDVLVRSRFLRGLVGVHDRLAVVRATLRTGGNPIGAEVSTMFRRSAFVAAGGYANEEMLADLDLWLRLLEHGDLHGQAAPVARFRIRSGSRTAAADAADERRHEAYLAALSAGTDGLRRLDRLWWRPRSRGVRWRRRGLFALARWRDARSARSELDVPAGHPAPRRLGRSVP